MEGLAAGRRIAISEPRQHIGLERPVELTREPYGQSFHRARERLCVLRLRDDVDVIVLHGELDETHAEPVLRLLERTQHDATPSTRA